MLTKTRVSDLEQGDTFIWPLENVRFIIRYLRTLDTGELWCYANGQAGTMSIPADSYVTKVFK